LEVSSALLTFASFFSKFIIMKSKKPQMVSAGNALMKDITETIKNPILLTMTGGNWSLVQSKIIENIVHQVQDQINERVIAHDSGFILDPSQVDNGLIRFEVPIKELGIPPQKYGELYAACETINKMNFVYETEDENNPGHYKRVWQNIFHRIEAPEKDTTAQGGEIQYKGGTRKIGILRVVMHEESARDILSLRKGYTTHLFGVPQMCRSPRTPRLYAFLSAWVSKGGYDFPYADLKEWCGVAKFNAKRTALIEDNYTKYSEFARSVIEPAHKEMKALADEGRVDFYFDYEPRYPGTKKRGNPNSIYFKIHLSERGKMSGEERFFNDLYSRLIRNYDLTPEEWGKLMPLLYGIPHERIFAELKVVAQLVERFTPQVPHAFVSKRLSDWAMTQPKVTEAEIVEEKTTQEEEHEPLFNSLTDYELMKKLVSIGNQWAIDCNAGLVKFHKEEFRRQLVENGFIEG